MKTRQGDVATSGVGPLQFFDALGNDRRGRHGNLPTPATQRRPAAAGPIARRIAAEQIPLARDLAAARLLRSEGLSQPGECVFIGRKPGDLLAGNFELRIRKVFLHVVQRI